MKYFVRFVPVVTVAFYLINPSTSVAKPSQNQSNTPKNLPACYIQSKNGKIIDLTVTCGFVRPAACGSSLGSVSRDAVLADFCKRNKRCLLTNTCNEIPRGTNMPPPGTPVGNMPQKELIA